MVSLDHIFCKSFANFNELIKFSYKQGLDNTLNIEFNIFVFPKSFVDATSLHITIGFELVAITISTSGILIAARN